jgi:hypothetical protein
MATPPTIAFFGTGSYLLFSLGVAKFLKETYTLPEAIVVTSSGGAIASVGFLTLQPAEFDDVAVNIATIFGRLYKDPLAWFRLNSTYREILATVVTVDRLPLLQNRLQIATTTLPFFKHKVYTGPFKTVDDVITNLQASAYIPIYFPRGPYKGHLFDVDAGLTMHAVDYSSSVIVSPKYKPGADVYWGKEKIQDSRFRSTEQHLEFYRFGYERAKEQVGQINVKLTAKK